MSDFFWIERGKWPQEAFGYVFLAQAVVEVGTVMFPGEWNGYEGNASVPDPLPADFKLPDGRQVVTPQPLAERRHRNAVGNALAKHRGWTKPHGSPNLWKFSAEEWADGIALVRAENSSRLARLGKFKAVLAAICKAALSGELVTALRPVPGGHVGAPLPVHIWNTENYRPRFHLCRMDPGDPFGNYLAGPRHQYIFVSRVSLDKFLAKIAPKFSDAVTTPAKPAKQFDEFSTWFHEQVAASPHERRITNEKLWPLAKERFGLAKHDVARERAAVLAKFPEETRRAWGSLGGSKGAAPKPVRQA